MHTLSPLYLAATNEENLFDASNVEKELADKIRSLVQLNEPLYKRKIRVRLDQVAYYTQWDFLTSARYRRERAKV